MSCTEQGRWAYASREFDESEVVADRQVRYAMKDSINASLASGAGHRSDQGRVWREVGALHARHATASPTAAMRDAYQTRKADLDAVLAAFPLQDGQQGMLVLHGARVVGLDLVSRAPQYAELHDKLLRSYAFEALVRDGEPGDRAVADAFLERIADLPGRRYKSPGLGWDVRYEGGGVLGSALTYRGHAVHAAFFDVGGVSGAAGDGGSGTGTRPPASGLAHRRRARARPPAPGALTPRAHASGRSQKEEETWTRTSVRGPTGPPRTSPGSSSCATPRSGRACWTRSIQSDVVVVAGEYDHVESVLARPRGAAHAW